MKRYSRHLIAVLGSVFCAVSSLQAQEVPTQVDRGNFSEIKQYVTGGENNNLYLKVAWLDGVMDGQVAAVKEDKPILLWLYFGGPLGNC